jgi:hypothetical protein
MAVTNLGRIGFVPQGNWSAGTYKNLDVVRYNSASYICKVATTTALPSVSTDWMMITSDTVNSGAFSNISGIVKGDGTNLSAATVRIDYAEPTTALATGILKNTTTTGAHSIAVAADFPTLNQNTTGYAQALKSATTTVDVSAATAPTTGQVLMATSGTTATWQTPSTGGGGASATKTISNKTAAYTVVAGDLGTIINCTSGTFTVSLTAAATLGAGFTCSIWNSSTSVGNYITIDPNGSETIDSRTTLVLRRGEGLDIVSDGTNWQTGNKKQMRGYAENFTASAMVRPLASADSSIAIGENSVASGTNSLALSGYLATASGTQSVSIGSVTTAGSNYSVALGNNSAANGSVTATGAGAVALGGSYASGVDSFAAAIADNTSSYGARGANSVAIGYQAKSTGIRSTSFGYQGFATGDDSIAAGRSMSVSGASSAGVGYQNTCSGANSYSFGCYSIASGAGSVTIGSGAKSEQAGKIAFGSKVNGSGLVQAGKIILTTDTTTSTSVALTSDGAAATTTNQLIVASGKAMALSGTLIAKQSASGNMAGWTITGIVSNNAGTMTVSGLALTPIGVDSIVLGVNLPTIAVDNTNKGVTITSGFKAATSIRWVCTLNTSEVTYA